MAEEIKIIQDPKILQQILSNTAGNKNNVNIFLIGQITNNGNNQGAEIIFDFEKFLESLPQPRLKSLINRAVEIASKKFHHDEEAGNWLGGSKRLINYRKYKNKEVEDV